MFTLQQLKEKRAKLLFDSKAIKEGARAADRETSDEEEEKLVEMLTEAKELKAQIERKEKMSQLDGELDAELKLLDKKDDKKTVGDKAITSNQKEKAEDDPKRGFKTPRDFLMEVLHAGQGLAFTDRLKPLAALGGDEQSGFSNQFGGFLVPEAFTPDLFTTPTEADPTAGRTTMGPMASPVVRFPARVDKDHSSSVSGGLRVFRRAEADTSATSRMQFEQVALNAHNLMGVSHATEEILTDSAISFIALLTAGFRDEFASKLIDEKLDGSGVGEFMGVNNSGIVISVAKETGQAADSIVRENIVKMRARCWGFQNAIWLANHDTYPTLSAMTLDVGTGGVGVWQPSIIEGQPDMLLGRPILFHEALSTVGDKGDLLLGNWSQYLEGMYQPLESAESIHVRFVNNERTFRFTMRNAGLPWWSSVLTPKNGSTLSPFVNLAARA